MSKDNKAFFEKKNDWSKTKDQLLGCYLKPYFQKVLTTNKPICYVDCFAGKGKFEDGSNGSPIIALENKNQCLAATKVQLNKSKAITMTFIDLNYSTELRKNVEGFSKYGMPNIVGGKYEETIFEVLKDKENQNVFLYIDPYGIRALDMGMFDDFKKMGFSSFEMLINFNSFGFFRNACRVSQVTCENDSAFQELDDLVEYEPTEFSPNSQGEQMLNAIAGGDYWKAIVADYKEGKIDGYQAEKQFSYEYKQELKKRFRYVLDMPIRLKENQRPKYRMIHVSDHPDACYLMARNIQKRKAELYTNVQTEGQISIFDLCTDCNKSVDEDVYTKSDISVMLQDTLNKENNNVRLKTLITDFVNEFGLICEFGTIHEILSELEKIGRIEIIRNPALDKDGNKRTFWYADKKNTITIRRLNP